MKPDYSEDDRVQRLAWKGIGAIFGLWLTVQLFYRFT